MNPLSRGLRWLAKRSLPRPLRHEYGDDILDLMAERLRDERARGGLAALRYGVRGGVDFATTALRTRLGRGAGHPALRPDETSPLSHWTPDMILRDFVFALRSLAHRPGFTAAVLLTLAIGIGANAMVYSAVDGIVLNPFDFPEPDRVLAVGPEFPRFGRPLSFFEVLSAPEYEDIQTQTESLEQVVGFDMGNRQITGGDTPENLRTGFWWGDPLRVLGLPPVEGRSLSEQDITERAAVALISHRVWQARFAGDPEVIGGTIQINDVDHVLIGVFPSAAIFYGIDVWLPMWAHPEEMPRGRRQFNILARAAEGADLRMVNAELDAIARRTEQEYAAEFEEYAGWRLEAMTWTDANVRTLKPAALVLMGTVAFVLLLVCANVASLLLSRAASRRREMAVRAALGAGRGRIVRQLMAENLLLAILGGIAGLGLAWIGLQWLVATVPSSLLPTTRPLGLNPRVLAYASSVSVLAGLVFGLAPALHTSRFDLQRVLGADSGTSTGSRSRRRLHGAFVAVEVALAIVLLAGAGLLLNSFSRLQRVEPGMQVDNVLTMRLTLPWEKFEGEAIANFFVELADRVEAIPGVRSAASGAQFAPIGFIRQQFALADQVVDDESELPTALLTIASADYFETLGIPLTAGRTITSMDLPGNEFVTVINQTLARRFFGDADPLAQRIKLGRPDNEELPWLTVVGVVGDTKNNGLAAPTAPEMYVGLRQVNGAFNQLYLLVRTEGTPRAVLPQIRSAVASLDPDQPIYRIQTLSEAFAAGFAAESVAMSLLGVFSVLALVLAAVGIFGVVAYAVSERSREIGLRMALGAAGPQVKRLVVRQALVPVTVGALVGLGLAFGLSNVMSDMLFEVRAGDPVTLIGVAVVLALVAGAASYLPARRASGIDPIVALRAD